MTCRGHIWLALALLSCARLGAASNPPLAEWARSTPPVGELERSEIASQAGRGSWRVFVEEGKLQVLPNVERVDWDSIPPFARPRRRAQEKYIGRLTAFEVSDGYIFGSDAGEWGGSAWWTDRKGKRRYPIVDGNFIGFAAVGDRVVGLTGMAHLFERTGTLHVFERQKERWREVRTVDVGGAAYAMFQESDGSLLIVTSNGLVRFAASVLIQVWYTHLGMFAPNSVVSFEGKYFVGMNHAVAEFAPREGGFVESWLRPRVHGVGQLGTATIRVVDVEGREIPGAVVELLREGRVDLSAVSNEEGRVSFSLLRAGDYVARAKMDGFRASESAFYFSGQEAVDVVVMLDVEDDREAEIRMRLLPSAGSSCDGTNESFPHSDSERH